MTLVYAICSVLYSPKTLKLFASRSLTLVIAFGDESLSLAGGELEQNRYRQYIQVSRGICEDVES